MRTIIIITKYTNNKSTAMYVRKMSFISSVKHGGGSIIVRAFFTSSGSGELCIAIIDRKINSELFQKTLNEFLDMFV